MKKAILPLILLISTALITPTPAHAVGLGSYYVGTEMGYAILNAGAGTHLDWGLTAGMSLLGPWWLGVFYDSIPFGSISTPSGISASGSEKFYGVQASFDFSPVVSGFSAGLRAGFSGVSTQAFQNGSETDTNNSGVFWGPVFAYERPVSALFSFGGEGYLLLPSENNARNALGLLATLKFWF